MKEGSPTDAPLWRIVLLGGLRLERQAETEPITHFRSQNIAGLLAYLALHLRQAHAREYLADLFWPDADPSAARTNLRTALASLRRQLEPPGVPAGSILVSGGQSTVELSPEHVSVDVLDFDRALRTASRSTLPSDERRQRLREAIGFYRGPLLPGFYDSWVLDERNRLEEMRNQALKQLAMWEEQAGDLLSALDLARQSVVADPVGEEGHATVIRLLMKTGQERAARLQFQELKRILGQEFGVEPGENVRALLRGSPVSEPPVNISYAGKNSEIGSRSGVPVRAERASSAAVAMAMVSVPGTVLHLPITLTRFFGREQEVLHIGEFLAQPDVRLLTLTGPGGTGKTRLAIEAARPLVVAFPGGIWFVSLAELRDTTRFYSVIGKSIGLPPAPTGDPQERVIRALEEKTAVGPVLLILDNFEQIVEAGAGLLADLLNRVGALSCLVTSRQRLLLEGEQEFLVRPLPTPEYSGTPELLMEFPSVQLFVNRAQAARPDFQLTGRNADSITTLCTRLEGIPLAIELSAAWCQTLTPAQMLERLNRRFDLLVSRRRDVSERHSTLRATIDWSYRLLAPDLQRFFTQLSLFRGGWTLEAAEAILDDPFAMAYLAELSERSLIVSEENQSATMRYRMLESLREFAEEQRSEAEAVFLQRRYLDFYAGFAESGVEALSGPQQGEWLNRLDEDHDNLRAVLAYYAASEAREDKEALLKLAGTLSRFWMVRGHLTEGRQHLGAALTSVESVSGAVRVSALAAAGNMAGAQGDRASAQHFLEACRDQSREIGDKPGLAQALSGLGNLALNRGNFAEARQLYEESVRLCHELGNRRGAARTLMMLGNVGSNEADFETARRYYEESLAISRELGDLGGIAIVYQNLGVVTSRQGKPREGIAWYEKSLAMRRELNDLPGLAATLETLGTSTRKLGDSEGATRYYEESLALRRQMQDRAGTMLLRLNLALAAIDRKEVSEAITQIRESLELMRESGNDRYFPYVLETYASTMVLSGQPEKAARLWGAAESLRTAIHAPSTDAEASERKEQMNAVAASLPEGVFAATLEEGRGLEQEQALEMVMG